MITITALIRVEKEAEAPRVAAYARDRQLGTVDFFVTAGLNEPNAFTTYERFVDRRAMEKARRGRIVKEVQRLAASILDAPIIHGIGEEIASK